MSTMNGVRAACALSLLLPASALFAQYSGTSHPEEVPITTSDEGIRQPVVFAPVAEPVAAVAPVLASNAAPVAPYELKSRAIPVASAEPVLSPDVDAGIVTRLTGPANALPVGSLLKVRLLQELSTKTTAEGSEWRGEVTEPLVRDGRVLVPTGSILRGKVTEVHGGKRISGQASIHLLPLSVSMPDGSALAVHAQVIDTNLYGSTRVDREGTILRRSHKKEEAAVLVLTAGSGAAAGALIGGVPGALIGGGVGVGVSAAMWLKQDHQTVLNGQTLLTLELTKPLFVGVE